MQSRTVQSRQLGRHLRELRKESGVSAEHAASELGLSDVTIYRYEAGSTVPKPPSVKVLCEMYGADERTRDALVALAKEAEAPGWWRSYNGAIPRWFDPFIAMESAASQIRAYDSEFILGLFQTKRYAEALILTDAPAPSDGAWPSAEEGRQRVNVRMERQRMLARRNPPALDVALGEAALMKSPGADVMAEQLAHLDQISRQPNVTLRIVPVDKLHPGLNCGARFTMLDFTADPPVVFADNLTGAAYLDKPADIKAYSAVWESILRVALTPGESRELIAKYVERYQQ